MRRCVWFRNLVNEEAMARVGPQRHRRKKNIKQFHYRPGQALRFPGGWGSQISTQSAYEGGKFVSPTHRPPLPPRKYSWYSFILEAESIVRSEGLCEWKIPITLSGIEPATFRLVAKCFNQLRNRVPPYIYIGAYAPYTYIYRGTFGIYIYIYI